MTAAEIRDLLLKIADAQSYEIMPDGTMAYVNRHRMLAIEGLAQLRREAGEKI